MNPEDEKRRKEMKTYQLTVQINWKGETEIREVQADTVKQAVLVHHATYPKGVIINITEKH